MHASGASTCRSLEPLHAVRQCRAGRRILNNSLYLGTRIFNRRAWFEVPNDKRGFRRQPRLNPEFEWIARDEPSLRIIDQPLWDAVEARQVEARAERHIKLKLTGNPLTGSKQPRARIAKLVARMADDERCAAIADGAIKTRKRLRRAR